jgi:ATP-dependent RNA helicase RhlB
MFDMGFVHDIQTILHKLPPRESRQTMLFSATLTPAVKHLASGSMKQPVEVHIVSQNITVDTIDQMVYHVGSSEKMSLLLGLLKKYTTGRALIFVNMKHMAEELAERLSGNGYEAEYLTGDLAQRQRQQRIDRFKNNELPLLIATDVAARGIHVDDLELVINYDIPMHAENYVHRIGRTARAGKSGHAVTLACETFVEFLEPIEKFVNMKLPSTVAEEELYLTDLTAGKNFRRSRKSSGSGTGGSRRSGPSGRKRTSGNRSSDQRFPDRSRAGKPYRKKSDRSGPAASSGKQTGGGRSGTTGSGTGRRKQSATGDRQKVQEHKQPASRQQLPVSHEKKQHQQKKGLFKRVFSLFK